MTALPSRAPSVQRALNLFKRHGIDRLEDLAKVDPCDDVRLALLWRRLLECSCRLPKLRDLTPAGFKRCIVLCERALQARRCYLCRKQFAAAEAARARSRFDLCDGCRHSARTVSKYRGWGMPTPVSEADKARQDAELEGPLQVKADEDAITARENRRWDAHRCEQERPGDGPLAGPKGPDFDFTNPEET